MRLSFRYEISSRFNISKNLKNNVLFFYIWHNLCVYWIKQNDCRDNIRASPSHEEVMNDTQMSLQLISGGAKSKNHVELLAKYCSQKNLVFSVFSR